MLPYRSCYNTEDLKLTILENLNYNQKSFIISILRVTPEHTYFTCCVFTTKSFAIEYFNFNLKVKSVVKTGMILSLFLLNNTQND